MTLACKNLNHIHSRSKSPTSIGHLGGLLRKKNQELCSSAKKFLAKLKQRLKNISLLKTAIERRQWPAEKLCRMLLEAVAGDSLFSASHRVEGKALRTHVEMMIVAAFGRRRWFVLSTAEVAATTQTTTAETTGTNAANQEQRLKLREKAVQ